MANMWDGAAYDSWQNELSYWTGVATSEIDNLSAAIGSYKAQKSYNETQREIARQTNEANERINAQNLAWEREKLASEQNYASFANQLAMARAAGVNPYTAIGNQTSSPSGGTPNTHGAVSPNQVVEDGFATGLRELSKNRIDAIRQLAASRKDNADATAQNIDNIVRSERNARELDSLGLTNVAQSIRNERDAALSPLQVENQDLENQHLFQLNDVLRLEQSLKQFDLDWMKPSEYHKLLEETRLLGQKIISESEYRSHLRRMDENGRLNAVANMMVAETGRMVAPSNIAQNYAQVRYYDAAAKREKQMELNYVEITKLNSLAARMKTTENDIYQEYARLNAWYDNKILGNKVQMSEYQVKQEYLSYLLNEKKLNWYDANQIVNSLIPLKYGMSSGPAENISGQKPVWNRVDDPYNPSYVNDPASGMRNYGNGVFEDSKGWLYDAQTGRWHNPVR